jgi:hypothetical protein
MDKENMVHIYTTDYYLGIKKKIMSFAGKWMGQENIMLNELIQTQEDKYLMFSLISDF